MPLTKYGSTDMSFLNSFFGTTEKPGSATASAVDVVTYVASLASDPRAIDPILEDVRELTARLRPGEALSDSDQTTLAIVYQKLEAYLISQDPLRHFDKPGLAAKITRKFPHAANNDTTFWAKLKT